MTINQQMANAARGWVGTPFHHQGRVKRTPENKGGCDCIGLIIGVARELGLKHIYENDESGYARMPDGEMLYMKLKEHLNEIPKEQMMEGDILLFRFDKNPQHVGIVSNLNGHMGIIHSYLQARGVVEHKMDEYWYARVVACFRV